MRQPCFAFRSAKQSRAEQETPLFSSLCSCVPFPHSHAKLLGVAPERDTPEAIANPLCVFRQVLFRHAFAIIFRCFGSQVRGATSWLDDNLLVSFGTGLLIKVFAMVVDFAGSFADILRLEEIPKAAAESVFAVFHLCFDCG